MSSLKILSSTAEQWRNVYLAKESQERDSRMNKRRMRKQLSPTRALRFDHVLTPEERAALGIITLDPMRFSPSRARSIGGKRSFDDDINDTFESDSSVKSIKIQIYTGNTKRKARPRDRKTNSRNSRTSKPPNINQITQDLPHPNPSRQHLFDQLRTGKKVIPCPGRPGHPMDVSFLPMADQLQDDEFEVCCVLRMPPEVYFDSRRTLITNHRRQGFYRKSAAQKMLKIDVNKTGKLYDFCQSKGWLPKDEHDNSYHDPIDL